MNGGEGGIRTPGRVNSPYNGLAIRRFRPLSHLSANTLLRTGRGPPPADSRISGDFLQKLSEHVE